jgi:hypothetical protein
VSSTSTTEQTTTSTRPGRSVQRKGRPRPNPSRRRKTTPRSNVSPPPTRILSSLFDYRLLYTRPQSRSNRCGIDCIVEKHEANMTASTASYCSSFSRLPLRNGRALLSLEGIIGYGRAAKEIRAPILSLPTWRCGDGPTTNSIRH